MTRRFKKHCDYLMAGAKCCFYCTLLCYSNSAVLALMKALRRPPASLISVFPPFSIVDTLYPGRPHYYSL